MVETAFVFHAADGRLLRTRGSFASGGAAEEWLYERWVPLVDLAVFSGAEPISAEGAAALLNELLEYRGLGALEEHEAAALLYRPG